MKLDVKALALAGGVFWGAVVFLLTWWMIAFDGPSGDPTLIGKVYRGYTVTPLGSLVGLLWALPDGLVTGAAVAWLYNRFAARPSSG